MENNLKFGRVRFFIILILIIIGICLCTDLAYIFYKTNFHEIYVPSFCNVSKLIDCDGVSTTQYAVSFGVPNALWGMFLYLVMLMLLFVDRIQNGFKNTIFDVFERPRNYIATLGIVSFLLSMVLAFISIKIINKICVLCFATYVINFLIAIVAKTGIFFIEDIKNTIVDFIKGAKKYFILFIIVLIAFISALYYLDETMIVSPKLKKLKMQKEFFEAKTNKYAIKGNVLGKKDAPVVVKIYLYFNCPFCIVANIMFHKAALSQNILIEEVNYPIDKTCNKYIAATLGGHDSSCLMAKYALAAKNQGKFWGSASVLFDKRPQTAEEIEKALKEGHLGLDIEKLKADAQSKEIEQQLSDDIDKARDKNVQGTPSYEIDGVLYIGAPDYDEFINKIRLAQIRKEKSK